MTLFAPSQLAWSKKTGESQWESLAQSLRSLSPPPPRPFVDERKTAMVREAGAAAKAGAAAVEQSGKGGGLSDGPQAASREAVTLSSCSGRRKK